MTFPQTAAAFASAQKSFAGPAPAENVSDVASERLRTSSRLFAYTRWDAVPVLAAISHCLYFFALFWLFSRAPLWVILPLVSSIRSAFHGTSTAFHIISFTILTSGRRC